MAATFCFLRLARRWNDLADVRLAFTFSRSTEHRWTTEVGFLTNFAAEVPELEGPVMTPRNNACIVQQELGRENFTTVTCQGVLRTRDSHSKTEEFHLIPFPIACQICYWTTQRPSFESLLHCLEKNKSILVKQILILSKSIKYHRVQPEARRHRSPLGAVSLATQGTC